MALTSKKTAFVGNTTGALSQVRPKTDISRFITILALESPPSSHSRSSYTQHASMHWAISNVFLDFIYFVCTDMTSSNKWLNILFFELCDGWNNQNFQLSKNCFLFPNPQECVIPLLKQKKTLSKQLAANAIKQVFDLIASKEGFIAFFCWSNCLATYLRLSKDSSRLKNKAEISKSAKNKML